MPRDTCIVCMNNPVVYLVTVWHRVTRQECSKRKVCSGCYDKIEHGYRSERLPRCAPHSVEATLSKTRI